MTRPGWCCPRFRASPGRCGDKPGEADPLSRVGRDRRALYGLEHDVQLVNPPHHVPRESPTEGGMATEQPWNGPAPHAVGPRPRLPAPSLQVLQPDRAPPEPDVGE